MTRSVTRTPRPVPAVPVARPVPQVPVARVPRPRPRPDAPVRRAPANPVRQVPADPARRARADRADRPEPRRATQAPPPQPRIYDHERSGRDRPAPGRRAEATGADGATPTAQAAAPVRRTVTIQGRGADRAWVPTGERRRPARRPHERDGFRPDRAAMWAVMLGLVLVLVAATSSHAAVRAHFARGAHGHAPAAAVHVARHAGAVVRATASHRR